MRTYLLIFFVGLGIYAGFAGNRLKIHTADNHFVYLADSFLKGRIDLARKPHHGNDWSKYEVMQLKGKSAETHGPEVKGFFTRRKGKSGEFRLLSGENITVPSRDRGKRETRQYVSFPPWPAVLMMPFVAAVGYGANDVVFTVVFAALNGVLFFMLLGYFRKQGYGDRSDGEHVWFTVLFALGSAHLWCSVLGRVWFTALIVGVGFQLLYIYFALDTRRPLLAGLCLAAAFSTRAALVFAAVFFYLQLFFPTGDRLEPKEKWRRFIVFSAPCLVVGVLLMAYNHARFESVFEFGHTYLAGGTIERIRDHGLFNSHFLGRNLTAAFTLTPQFSDTDPHVLFSKHGMSIFLSTPALLWLFLPARRSKLVGHLALTALFVAVPIFFYQNTGWEQFGYRFILDFLPYLVLILVLGGQSMGRWLKALILVGVLVNALGAGTFQRSGSAKLYGHFLMDGSDH